MPPLMFAGRGSYDNELAGCGLKGGVEEKQGQSHAEVWAEMRRTNEKAARERAELYRERDDEDRDRER